MFDCGIVLHTGRVSAMYGISICIVSGNIYMVGCFHTCLCLFCRDSLISFSKTTLSTGFHPAITCLGVNWQLLYTPCASPNQSFVLCHCPSEVPKNLAFRLSVPARSASFLSPECIGFLSLLPLIDINNPSVFPFVVPLSLPHTPLFRVCACGP